MTTRDDFNDFVERQCETIKAMLVSKGLEYNKDSDAFSNFYNGVHRSRKNKTPIDVLEGYRLKHDISIDLILEKAEIHWRTVKLGGTLFQEPVSKEMINDKFDDEINYWILLKGLLYDIYGYNEENLNN